MFLAGQIIKACCEDRAANQDHDPRPHRQRQGRERLGVNRFNGCTALNTRQIDHDPRDHNPKAANGFRGKGGGCKINPFTTIAMLALRADR